MSESGMPITADGVGGDFFWRYCAEADHIEAAAKALLDAIRGGDERVWRPAALAMTKREFRNRLTRATKGRLREPQQVKGIRRGTEIHLGEIRWSGITVVEHRNGQERGLQIQARLYYAEPDGHGRVILGLHCHEKRTDGTEEEVRGWQDLEIDRALDCFAEGANTQWGVDLEGLGIVQPPMGL